MKTGLFLAISLLISGSAMAHGNGNIMRISCSDPRVNKHFSTRSEAANTCNRWRNTYVTYDNGFHAYTCGCTSASNGEGQGAQVY